MNGKTKGIITAALIGLTAMPQEAKADIEGFVIRNATQTAIRNNIQRNVREKTVADAQKNVKDVLDLGPYLTRNESNEEANLLNQKKDSAILSFIKENAYIKAEERVGIDGAMEFYGEQETREKMVKIAEEIQKNPIKYGFSNKGTTYEEIDVSGNREIQKRIQTLIEEEFKEYLMDRSEKRKASVIKSVVIVFLVLVGLFGIGWISPALIYMKDR